MNIVRDGLVLVGGGGRLLLTDGRDSGLTSGSGLGLGSELVVASPSSSPSSSSSTNLPPLPSSVEAVRFTWIANELVMYFPLHMCIYIYAHKIYIHAWSALYCLDSAQPLNCLGSSVVEHLPSKWCVMGSSPA